MDIFQIQDTGHSDGFQKNWPFAIFVLLYMLLKKAVFLSEREFCLQMRYCQVLSALALLEDFRASFL